MDFLLKIKSEMNKIVGIISPTILHVLKGTALQRFC